MYKRINGRLFRFHGHKAYEVKYLLAWVFYPDGRRRLWIEDPGGKTEFCPGDLLAGRCHIEAVPPGMLLKPGQN